MKSNLSPFLRGVVASMEDDQTRDAVVVAETAEEAEAAVAEANSEITEATSELEQIEEDVQKLEDAAAGVESIVLALEAAQLDGGLTPQAAVFMNIALASYAEPIGLSTSAIPSVESFGGASARLSSTVASLEASKGIWESIKEALLKAWKAVRDFMVGLWNKLFNATAALKQYAEKLKKAVAKGELKSGDVKFAGVQYLVMEEKAKPDAKTAIQDVRHVVAGMTAYAEDIGKTAKDLGAQVKAKIALAEWDNADEEGLAKDIAKLAVKKVPAMFTEQLDGTRTYLESRKLPGLTTIRIYGDRHTDGDSAVTNALNKVINLFPNRVVIESKADDVLKELNDGVPALTKSEINSIADDVIGLVKDISVSKKAFEAASKTAPEFGSNVDAKVRKEIVKVAREYSKMNSGAMKISGKVNAYALKVGKAAVKYGFASLK